MKESLLEFISTPLFLITLTVGSYLAAKSLYERVKTGFLHPLIVSSAIVIVFLLSTGIDYEVYYEANSVINFMLGMSIVSLGYLLYVNLEHIRGRHWSILISVTAGCITGVISVIALSEAFGLAREIAASVQPKSVTMPIAVALSENSGGILSLTSLAVVVTGVFGSMVGPWLLRMLNVTDPVARGLALGTASHAVGTARAVELGAVEGAVGGAAIGIMGIMTAIVIPIVEKLLY